MVLTKLKRERALDSVHSALKDAILNSVLRPGERLDVGDIAAELGVSLTPVRNAVELLTKEGLVEVRPRSGTFVASVSVEDVSETFEIRCALECLAAEKAVDTLSDNELKRLRSLLDALAKPVRTAKDQKAHQDRNAEFHLIFLQAAGNRKLIDMYNELNANIKIARIHAGEADWLERLEQEQREHEAIVEAAEARDAGLLIKAVRNHIVRARDSLVAAVNSVESKR